MPLPTTSSRLLTVAAAAPRLGVPPAVVQAWVADGLLPAQTLPGGELRIPVAALQATRRRLGFPT